MRSNHVDVANFHSVGKVMFRSSIWYERGPTSLSRATGQTISSGMNIAKTSHSLPLFAFFCLHFFKAARVGKGTLMHDKAYLFLS